MNGAEDSFQLSDVVRSRDVLSDMTTVTLQVSGTTEKSSNLLTCI